MFDFTKAEDCCVVRGILKGVSLRDYQALCSMAMAMSDGRIVMFNTGMGKTYAALAGLQLRANASKSKRILWIGPLATIPKVRSDFRKHTDLRCATIRGNEDSLEKFYRSDITSAEVVLVNLEAFDNAEVIDIFRTFSFSEYFDTIVIDEAHHIANPFYSNRNSFIYMMAYRIKACYLLTATPIISENLQYASLIALVTKSLSEIFSIRQAVAAGEYMPEKVRHIVSYKDRAAPVDIKVCMVAMYVDVERAPGLSIFNYTRGANAIKVNEELLSIIRENPGEKFLIHSCLTCHHKFLQTLVKEELGLNAGIVSSATKNIPLVQEQFENGTLDCLIFSLTTGLDMPAGYTIMYDWTVYAAQAIGRALRTEEINGYRVYLIVTDNPKEISLLKNSVIKNGLLTERALGFNSVSTLKMR